MFRKKVKSEPFWGNGFTFYSFHFWAFSYPHRLPINQCCYLTYVKLKYHYKKTMAGPMTEYRLAKTAELDQLKAFLFHHGANPWNHLPADGVDVEFALIAAGQAAALVAYSDDQPVGLAIFYHPNALPENYLQYCHARSAIYIAEVVVHKDYSGRGIGTSLLEDIIRRAPTFGAEILLVDRHTENMGSAGMMRKVGFKELSTFIDLDRRDFGNRSTTVLSFDLI